MKTDNAKFKERETKLEKQDLEKLFIDQIKDLYSAELQLIKALPKMVKAAVSSELKSAFEEHWQETKEHAHRLETILSNLNVSRAHKKCAGMEGIIEEGEATIKKNEPGEIKDADLIAVAQRVEHYEMAGYGTVRTFAQMLGFKREFELLQQTLDEEGDADKRLTVISEQLLQFQEV